MKKFMILLVTIVWITNVSSQENPEVDKEKEAIVALIEEETQSYYDRDYERWSDCYVESEDNHGMYARKNWHNYIEGWKAHSEQMKPLFDTEKEVNRETKKPVTIKIYDKTAWIVFENESFDENNESLEQVRTTYFLEKHEDKWKITYSNRVYTNTFYTVNWAVLDMIRYAKTLGKSPEDIGNFFSGLAKEDWDEEMGYEEFQNVVINNFRNRTPADGFKILEQDDDHVVLTASGIAADLQKSGTINEVSYEDFLKIGETFWTQTGNHVGADFKQELDGEEIKVSVQKKK